MSDMLGDDWRIYHDTAETWGSETWVNQTNLSDVGFDHGGTKVEVPKRQTHKKYKQGRQDWALTFTLNVSPGDTFYEAVMTAIEAGTPVHLALASDDIATAGTKYWHADWLLMGPIDGALDGNSTADIEASPHADSVNTPAKETVSS